jgi:hypothetical protein
MLAVLLALALTCVVEKTGRNWRNRRRSYRFLARKAINRRGAKRQTPAKWPNPAELQYARQLWVDTVVNRKFLQK